MMLNDSSASIAPPTPSETPDIPDTPGPPSSSPKPSRKSTKRAKRPNSLSHQSKKSFKGLAIVCLSALGVVFGDIGTSPLYVFKSVFSNIHPTEENVLGVSSLIFYVVTLVVCIKYLIFVMRADHMKEGGVFALLSLILFGGEGGKQSVLNDTVPLRQVDSQISSPSSSMAEFDHINVKKVSKKLPHRWVANRTVRRVFIILSMLGSGLLLGDGVITPAISVLSAVEGLQIASNDFEPAIMPITIFILIGLFAVQRYGTSKVGALFGPIMVIWFAAIASCGIYQIAQEPSVFKAFNPYYAFKFFSNNGLFGWESLGAVVLCITGCEAMYADMGHFGVNSVRIAWLVVVYPSLIMNYLGQGALLLRDPSKMDDPFFLSVPEPVFWPMFALSIMATIIASQALISGAFSLTQQAVSLASFPRLKIVHTSKSVEGQIYIPAINVLLMVCCVVLVAGFRTSEDLANAYGVAVCGDMLLTTTFFLALAFLRWRWHPIIIAWLALQFGLIDIAFLTSNLRKVPSGGWFPLLFAAVLVVLMYVWRTGQLGLKEKLKGEQAPVESLLEQVREGKITQCSGVGVFMSAAGDGIPHVCTQFLKHVPVMHSTAVFLTVKYKHEPFVARAESRLTQLGPGIYRIVLECGYMETTLNIEHLNEVVLLHNIPYIDFATATYYLGNELVAPMKGTWIGHRMWVELFNLLLQFSHKSTAAAFRIPDRNLIYVGNNYML